MPFEQELGIHLIEFVVFQNLGLKIIKVSDVETKTIQAHPGDSIKIDVFIKVVTLEIWRPSFV